MKHMLKPAAIFWYRCHYPWIWLQHNDKYDSDVALNAALQCQNHVKREVWNQIREMAIRTAALDILEEIKAEME